MFAKCVVQHICDKFKQTIFKLVSMKRMTKGSQKSGSRVLSLLLARCMNLEKSPFNKLSWVSPYTPLEYIQAMIP